MSTTIAELKKNLRREFQQLKISGEARATFSRQACERLQQQVIWRAAKCILFFDPLENEVDVRVLIDSVIAQNKIAALPKFLPEKNAYGAFRVENREHDCALGKFGIAEPGASCLALDLKQLDLVLVPGVAFDLAGRRLGRGRGFYDRLLAEVRGTKCGVAFDQQIAAEVPIDPHDIILDCIVTPTRWLDFHASA